MPLELTRGMLYVVYSPLRRFVGMHLITLCRVGGDNKRVRRANINSLH